MAKKHPAAEAIRRFLDQSGWTQEQFGEWAGISRSAVARWVSGDRQPGPSLAIRIDTRARKDGAPAFRELSKERLRPDLFRTKD